MGLFGEHGLIKSLREHLAEDKIQRERVAEEIERLKIDSFR
jgi:hypothetical protein